MNNKAIIAMSGGVDSSVAAYIMKQNGYVCTGVTMKLFRNEDVDADTSSKACCTLEDSEDAKGVAMKLGMQHYVFNFTADFKKQVIDRFVSAYENGITPNPCIDCNRYLKFEALYLRAMAMGCDYIATGHYAQIEESSGRYLLKRALDPSKDQSYVLYSMTQEQLKRTVFPLGGMHKSDVRKIASELGFINANKPDSQDICFVPDGNYVEFIRKYTGKNYLCGNFCDKCGNVLGQHSGIIGYTLGQRKGLGIAAGKPLYVTKICPETNTIILGNNADLFSSSLDAVDFNWIAFETPPASFRADVKIRYNQPPQPATVTVTDKDSVHIVFDKPQRAITRGQAAVLYDGDVVIGGGVISDS